MRWFPERGLVRHLTHYLLFLNYNLCFELNTSGSKTFRHFPLSSILCTAHPIILKENISIHQPLMCSIYTRADKYS